MKKYISIAFLTLFVNLLMASVSLEIQNVDTDAGTLDIYMTNDEEVGGFQIEHVLARRGLFLLIARIIRRILLDRLDTVLGARLGFVAFAREDVFAIEQDFALGDLIVFLAGEHIAQRRLARAVAAHDGMDFASIDRQIDTTQNFFALN